MNDLDKYILSESLQESKERWISASLGSQYFPNARRGASELPPLFECVGITKEVAKLLSDTSSILKDEGKRTSPINFRTRRFDGLLRAMNIPHPTTQSALCLHIEENWQHIWQFLRSRNSKIRFSYRGGKIYEMSYSGIDDSPGNAREALEEISLSANKNFRVIADISNCFPSVYTHAVDWALRGKFRAKEASKSRGKDKSWEAKLDTLLQNSHHGETKGVGIGPLTSTLSAEIILQRVDRKMRVKGYKFTRHIDDYVAYFLEVTECESFIKDLDRELAHYKLSLNSRKTRIEPVQGNMSEEWIASIHMAISAVSSGRKASENVRFLRQMEKLALAFPGFSVLKYALEVFTSLAEEDLGKPEFGNKTLCMEITRLCYLNPHLVAQSAFIFEKCRPSLSESAVKEICALLSEQLLRSCTRGESDVTAWIIHILGYIFASPLSEENLNTILATEDEVSLTALIAQYPEHRGIVAHRLKEKEADYKDAADYQEHWLTRYELFRQGFIPLVDISKECERAWFNVAKDNGVRFTASSYI